MSKPAAKAVALVVDEAAAFLFYSNRLRAGMTPLQNYPAYDERDQPMQITRFPFHRGRDFYSHGGLSPAIRIEAENEQRRLIKFLVNRYRGLRAKRPPSTAFETEIIAFGHLYDQAVAIGIRPRPSDEERLAAVGANDRYAAIQRADAYFEFRTVSFINSVPQPAPLESPDAATIHCEDMADAAMTFAPDDDFTRSDEIALERFARRFD